VRCATEPRKNTYADKERLSISLERATRRLGTRDNLSGDKAEANPWLSRLAIKDENGIVFVPVEQILWIEAANKYVVVHTTSRTHIVRQTIKSLEDTLNPKEFLRIHRSILVRKAAVRGLHPLFHGDYIVKLTNGEPRQPSPADEARFRTMLE
jgi:two-component system LytT family response regulator